MSRYGHFLTLCALLLSGACIYRSRPAGAAKAAPRAQVQQTRKGPSPEIRKKTEKLYYQAVDAYSKNDMPAARDYLKEISALDPAYPLAKDLETKVRLVIRNSPGPAAVRVSTQAVRGR